jgi:hypothetical protein
LICSRRPFLAVSADQNGRRYLDIVTIENSMVKSAIDGDHFTVENIIEASMP